MALCIVSQALLSVILFQLSNMVFVLSLRFCSGKWEPSSQLCWCSCLHGHVV